MSKSSLCLQSYGTVNTQQLIFGNKQSVTQGSSLTTTVALDAPVGNIVCYNSTLATGGSASFTFSNSYIQSGSILFTNVQGYTGASSDFKVKVISTGSNYATLNILNGVNTGPMNGVITVGYMVV